MENFVVLLAGVALLLGIIALSRLDDIKIRIMLLEREVGRMRVAEALPASPAAIVPPTGVAPAAGVPYQHSGAPVIPPMRVPAPARQPRRQEVAVDAMGVPLANPPTSSPDDAGRDRPKGPQAPREPMLQPVIQKVRSTEEWEALIGGRWMNRVGALALILGVGLFFKYAIDNNWISQSLRVGIGMVVGMALLAGAWRAHQRDLSIFAQGLAGAGLAILYLSIYASYGLYHLVPALVALTGLGVITAAAFVLALYYDSLAVAALAWLGGFATIPLLGFTDDTVTGAITYVVLLYAGILAIVFTRDDWFILEPLAMVATYGISGWYLSVYDSGKLVMAAVALSIFWALYYILDVSRTLTHTTTHSRLRHLMGGANALLYWIGALVLLADHPRVTGFLALGLGGVYLVTILGTKRWLGADDGLDARYTLTAIILAVIATPILTSGFAVPILWSLEACGLLWCGIHWNLRYVWWPGIWLYALASYALLTTTNALSYAPIKAFTPMLNTRVLAFLTLAATLGAGSIFLRRLERERASAFVASFQYAWCATLFLLITVETLDFFQRQMLGSSYLSRLHLEQLRSLTLAVLWMVYSLPLLYSGLRARVFPLLSAGMAVVAVAVRLGAGAGASYQPIERFTLILNSRALLVLLLLAGLIVHLRWLHNRRSVYPWIGAAMASYGGVILLLGFELITAEIHDYFRHASGAVSESAGVSGLFLEITTLAAIWLLYSIPLVRYGIKNRAPTVLLTGLGALGAATGAGAFAALAFEPSNWLGLALTVRPIVLLGLIVGIYLQMQWIRNAQNGYTWLTVALIALQACTVLLGFELVSAETRDFFGHQITAASTTGDAENLGNLQQLTFSIVWLLYAGVLLAAGFWRRVRWMRLGSIALLAFVLGKVVLYDLTFLNPAYRSVSFVGMGVILLAASYLYQRHRLLLLEGV